MERRVKVATILLLAVVSCRSNDDAKRIAQLEETVRQQQAQIGQERKAREQTIATDDARYQEVMKEKARADDLLEKIRNVMGAPAMANLASAPVSYAAQPQPQVAQAWTPTVSTPTPEVARRDPPLAPHRPPTDDRTIIEACAAKWGSNYEMVEYCQKEQQTAKDALATRESAHPINDAVMAGIRRDCQGKWLTNFEMRDYCEKEQVGAYQRVNTH